MKKFIILLLCIAIGIYLYAPYRTVGKYRDALNTGDTATLNSLVDFPQLRKTMRGQLLQKLTAENQFAGAAAILAGPTIDTMLEGIIDETNIGKLLALGKVVRGAEPQTIQSVSWIAPHKVSVKMSGDESLLTFTLTGKGWKLTGKEVGDTLSKLQSLLISPTR